MSEVNYSKLEAFYGPEKAIGIIEQFDRLIRFMKYPVRSLGELTDMYKYTAGQQPEKIASRIKDGDVTGALKGYAERLETNFSRGVEEVEIKPGDVSDVIKIHVLKRDVGTRGSVAPPKNTGRRKYVAGGSQVGYKSGM